MFEPPPASRRRPMFLVSAAAHLALAVVLVVPPLLATPEAPEPDGFVRIDTIPVLISEAPVLDRENLLGKGTGGGEARSSGARTNEAVAAPPALRQPADVTELLPAPTGEQPELPFEETGERSQPESDNPGVRGGPGYGSGEPGCEGCSPLSASAPGVTPPVALVTISPAYPELARRSRVEGVVVLEAIIGSDGWVRDVRVLRSAQPLLDPAALEAVRHWRYRPARVGDRPVAVTLNVVVTFSLRNP